MPRLLLPLLVLLPLALHAQDDQTRVISPNGQFEFRLFSGQPKGALWPRIGYQVWYQGKPLLTTSWLGIDIRDQEPYLAENPGFMYTDKKADPGGRYNSAIAHYMQNGSLGRRLDIEIRAFDDGVAFRYLIPPSTPLIDFLIRNERTEFNFADASVLNHLPDQPDYDMPLVLALDSTRFAAIADAGPQIHDPDFPRTYLVRTATGLITNLSASKTERDAAYAAKTPVAWPWRAILAGTDREQITHAAALRSLEK